MNHDFKIAAVALFAIASFATNLHSQSPGGDELNLGVQAYRQARVDEAIQHFEKAVAQAPENVNAHLYLATAYAQQYIPALDTPENNGLAERAIKHYQHVLDSDAVHNDKINSAKGIAYLYLNMKEFEDSKKYYRMVSDLDPKDPEPHYYIGVIDWTMCYKPRMEERAKLGVQARRGSESDRSRSEEGLRRAEGQEHAHP